MESPSDVPVIVSSPVVPRMNAAEADAATTSPTTANSKTSPFIGHLQIDWPSCSRRGPSATRLGGENARSPVCKTERDRRPHRGHHRHAAGDREGERRAADMGEPTGEQPAHRPGPDEAVEVEADHATAQV